MKDVDCGPSSMMVVRMNPWLSGFRYAALWEMQLEAREANKSRTLWLCIDSFLNLAAWCAESKFVLRDLH
jgi:hypothetical protein